MSLSSPTRRFAALRSLWAARCGMLLCSAAMAFAPVVCTAQFGGGGGLGGGGGGGGLGGGGGGGGLGGGGAGGGGGTIGDSAASGVVVDANGILRRVEATAADIQLIQLRLEQAEAELDQDLAAPSPLRKVSLTRLVSAIQRALAAGEGPDDVMQRVAGLTRVRYIFFYPETRDLVLAGPAEGWIETPQGRVVGIESGQPVLSLEDLVVALRLFDRGVGNAPLVHCSIDPTPEGLARTQQFLSQLGRNVNSIDEQMIVEGLSESMGTQVVTIGGVPARSHFAQVMVEADYRMKLIGIGLEQAPAGIASFVSMANPSALASNALVRWWFVPDYQRIKQTERGDAVEFVGNGVKLVGEDELVASDGGRSRGGRQNGASMRFTKKFSDKYGQLAEQSPIYAELRNCIDLLIAAAYMREHGLMEKAGIELAALANEADFPVERFHAPKQVATAVNAIWKGRRLMTPFGGGVEIRAAQALEADNRRMDDGEVAKVRDTINVADLSADAWWWD